MEFITSPIYRTHLIPPGHKGVLKRSITTSRDLFPQVWHCSCLHSVYFGMLLSICADYESHLWDSFLYPVETRGPVMVPGAVTPGVCIRGPVFRIQSVNRCSSISRLQWSIRSILLPLWSLRVNLTLDFV